MKMLKDTAQMVMELSPYQGLYLCFIIFTPFSHLISCRVHS